MSFSDRALHDLNMVPSATFEVDQKPGTVMAGQIDQTTGRILVDVSGGAGAILSLEIPSGTVNGVNTVFTVANTPVFIEVSGQVMVSQSQDGTNYGFTYSAGTVTFVNAPTQTPHSFYNSAQGGSSFSSLFVTDTFTSTNNQTVFSTSQNVLVLFSFVVNGQTQMSTDYTFNGLHTFTLNSGIPAGLPVTIVYAHT